MKTSFLCCVSISLPIYNAEAMQIQFNQMDRQYLIDFTQETNHHGVSSPEILSNFMKYQRMCCDPLNVFRFMEEKVICTFMPQFWIEKSFVEAKMGDYQSSFESLDMASQYIEDGQQKQKILLQIEEYSNLFQKQMVINMRKNSVKTKRTAQQSSSTLLNDSLTLSRQRKKDMLDLYKKQYGALQAAISKKEETDLKIKYPESWLLKKYEQEDSRQNQIISEILLESSIKYSRTHQSMFTPRKRDPVRVSKALDSVEMAKKKILSREKQREQSKEESDEEDSNNLKVLSLPVGKKYQQIKKKNRVTFKRQQSSTDRIREKEHPQSSGKGLRSIMKRKKPEKMDIEDPDN